MDQRHASSSGPIFILGLQRGGTNQLLNILRSHPGHHLAGWGAARGPAPEMGRAYVPLARFCAKPCGTCRF